jgi:predicted ATPase/serine phosphatase RsbU (regulator of sigma subunit)/tRNA A-37 threonylcarbamoyl transferase component Bud32
MKLIGINGYQILTQIYESANSIVYRGIQEQDKQPVILKMLKQDYPTPAALTRYKQEYEIIRNLNLEGVVKAYSLEEYHRTLVIILEDFGGNSLKQLMHDSHLVPVNAGGGGEQIQKFLHIALQTAEILAAIHAANVIHKDINPANIVLHPETGQLKLIDFGIASVLSRENPTLKNPNVLEGTLAYISPEQTGRMNRTLDYRTDFYSLGVTFYELLTGQLPFKTIDPLELVHCHIAKQPVSPHELNLGIPKAVSEIVMKLMAKTAEDRYQSGWGLKADLECCLRQLQHQGEISEFSLGTQDISDKFQIPQKLYGREAEIATLLAAFERVAGGGAGKLDKLGEKQTTSQQNQPSDEATVFGSQSNSRTAIEMMLVAGYSGIGKSALVQEIYKPITRSRGYFISGKFDQFQRNIPYSAIVNAFTGLLRQLLTETEAQLEKWREKVLTALGVNGQVIIDIIPELELIVGKQSAVPELGATESQNRFKLVFQNFIRAFCTSEHPLVIFLDDLQWADSATLKLIELMMTDRETEHLFLIGSYRDNEVSPTHLLMITLEELRQVGVIIHQITLEPLSLNQVSQLIAETLHSDTKAVKSLAELVVNKTQGNPFFINEFLKTLYQEKLLKFDLKNKTWRWDINQIEAMNITDNVVNLMIDKLKMLPSSTQQNLHLAACIGAKFHLNTLSLICEQPATEIFSDLKAAIQSGLILTLSELDAQLLIQDYQFGHDRIQQAAYTLIDETQKKAAHLKIGYLLLHNSSQEVISEKIFEIVDHLDTGIELVTKQQERDAIATLNLMAGQKAKASTAYSAAVQYLHTGLELLAEDSWQTQYELTLNLYTEAVEAEYLNANFEQAEKLAEVVLGNAKTVLDKFNVYDAKIQFSCIQNQMLSAIDTGLQLLKMLSVTLSESPPNNLNIETLYNLPEMTDPALLSAMRILMNLFSPAYISNPTLLPTIAFTMLKLCLQQGNSPQAAFAYAFYGVLLCTGMDDMEAGYEFGRLALQVLEKFEARDIKCKVHEVFNAFIRHWREPARASIEALRETVQFGLETGDLEFAGYSAIHYCAYLALVGEPLESVYQKQMAYIGFLHKSKQEFSLYYAQVWVQLVLNFMERQGNRNLLIGEIFNEEKMLPFLQENNNLSSLFCIHLAKSILSYLFKDYKEAANNAAIATNYEQAMAGLLPAAQQPFYYSLSLLALYPTAEIQEKFQYIETVNSNQNKLKKWSKCASINFQYKYDLIEAEKARVLGQNWQAAEFYERAIKGAKDNGYIQDEALASELAAEFYLAVGMDKIAQTYLKEAHYSYSRWQAWAKVKDLELRYPQLLTKSATATRITDTGKTTTSITTSTSSGVALDLATVIKASQAIGSEIVLEQLLCKLMKIIIENAGAQTGVLLLETQNQLFIEAEGSVDDENITVLQSIALENRLPISIINYVARTCESIVLGDATREGNFTNDPYIQQHHPKSILCFPISDRGKLVSIVYLENNLAKGAFTPERLEVLKILSAQAAISIENARLYQNLEDKVSERTAQLAQANAEITTLNEKLKAENLRMSAELEVTKQLQQMVLPKREELDSIEGLEIAGYMEPADEVGGDYYDVLQQDGKVKIGIGDVTGHGLESGVLMLMTQTAVRTLQQSHQTDPVQFLDILNRTIYGNVQRINPDKNLTLALLDYSDGTLSISGQHEEIIVVRAGGLVERIDTTDLGFPIGLDEEITDFIASEQVQLNPGDVVVLYTDGITEAFDIARQQYGIERLCKVVSQNCEGTALEIRQAVIEDVRRHIGEQKVFDDITLVVLKQK